MGLNLVDALGLRLGVGYDTDRGASAASDRCDASACSSVMKGVMGWARRRMVSNVRISVRRAALLRRLPVLMLMPVWICISRWLPVARTRSRQVVDHVGGTLSRR